MFLSQKIRNYELEISWSKHNGKLENGKDVPAPLHIHKGKIDNKQQAEYYGHWWWFSIYWIYLDITFYKLA